MYHLFAAFLIFSGIASLTYQVTWVRLLSQSLGSTHASISTVLAAFFLGLAAGSYLAEKFTEGKLGSLRPYLVLEALIGISGLILLPILLNLDLVLSYAPAFGSQLSLKFLLTSALLVIPTTCMGATFPVMAAILVRQKSDMGQRISQLYSFNTFGAVLGACLTGFVLIPRFGLDGSIYIAVALNLAIAVIGLLADLKIKLPDHELRTTGEESQAIDSGTYRQFAAAATLAATGFVAIAIQVGWTKYLSIFTGSTIYGFSAILTIFLAGIAFGSHAIRNRLDMIRGPESIMSALLLLLAVSLMIALAGLSFLPELQLAINDVRAPDALKHTIKYALIAVIIFPPTFLFGAIFPLNLRLYCIDLKGVQKRIGKAYAINTIASIFGAIFAGFWVIPTLGTNFLLILMSLAILLLPLFWLPLITSWKTKTALTGVSLAAFLAINYLPQINFEAIVKSVEYTSASDEKQKFLFLKEGKTGVVSLVTRDGKTAALQNNGLQESEISLVDPNASLLVEGLLGLVPYMIHQKPEKAFVLGFGGGITTRALTRTDLKRIHVVELEPHVVDAVSTVKNGPYTALSDPRVEINFNDARNTLLVGDETYDIIVSQPSHPWLAGSANVFTREFWQIANNQLSENGVFSQWINLFRMDSETLKSLFQAFYSVFPHGFSLANMDSGDLLLIGSKSSIRFDPERINRILADPQVKPLMASNGINNANDILWYFALSRDQALNVSKGAQPNSDTNLLSEVRLSGMLSDPVRALDPYRFLNSSANMDVAWMFGDAAAEKVHQLSLYSLQWENDWIVRKLIAQLRRLDPLSARSISHQRLVKIGEAEKAKSLYQKYQDWPEINHLIQAGMYIHEESLSKAKSALSKVKKSPERDRFHARLLFKAGDTSDIATYRFSEDETRLWYLLSLANSDPETAGSELTKMNLGAQFPPEALQFLVEHHAVEGNSEEMRKYALLLSQSLGKN